MSLLNVLGLRPTAARSAAAAKPLPAESPAPGRLLPDWDAAAAAAAAQIAKLQVALRQHSHPMAPRIADAGLSALVGRVQGGLQGVLAAFDKASSGERESLRPQVAQQVLGVRARMKAEKVLPLLDSNPVGILVTVSDGLEDALSRIEAAVSAH